MSNDTPNKTLLDGLDSWKGAVIPCLQHVEILSLFEDSAVAIRDLERENARLREALAEVKEQYQRADDRWMEIGANYEKELAEAKREIDRLNQWADSFTDAHLKERQTGDALVKETMQRAEQAEARALANEKDAVRYRWLRDNKSYVAVDQHYRELPKAERTGWTIRLVTGNDANFDTAIDSALKASAQEGQ